MPLLAFIRWALAMLWDRHVTRPLELARTAADWHRRLHP